MYPTYRYHVDHEPVLCNTPKDVEELGPGWADSPAAARRLASDGPHGDDGAAGVPAESVPSAPSAPQPDTGASATSDGISPEEQAARDELYAEKARTVVKAVKDAEDTALLERLLVRESANPAGPRATVMQAIQGRLTSLARAAMQDTDEE